MVALCTFALAVCATQNGALVDKAVRLEKASHVLFAHELVEHTNK